MSEERKPGPDDGGATLGRHVGRQAARRLHARGRRSALWFGLGMFGQIGWSVTVPTLLGVLLGRWLDTRHPAPHSWTLTLLVAGLTLGCANAWHWVSREDRRIREEEGGDD